MPQTSVKVHVRKIVKLFAQPLVVVTSTGLTVIDPSQLSVVARVTAVGTSAAHCTVTAAGAAGATGAISSFTVIV